MSNFLELCVKVYSHLENNWFSEKLLVIVCYGKTFPYMLCSMFVYYLNVFCLSFFSETKVLYDVLLYVQLQHR